MKKHTFLSLILLNSINLVACSNSIPDSVTYDVNFEAKVNFHSKIQQSLIDSDDPKQYIKYEWGGIQDEYKANCKPVTISWNAKADNNAKASRYEFNLWEGSDKDNAITYKTKDSKIDLYNLKINTSYNFSISAYYGEMNLNSLDYYFDTYNCKSVRNLYVEGVENMRDLGGYQLDDPNKVMKQGLIYRSAQFNYNQNDETGIKSAPTKEGKRVLIDELKIKTEIDLREKSNRKGEDETLGITSSPISKSVNYNYLPMRFGGSNVLTNSDNFESLKTFFELCADIKNYPIVFHCIRGTDRTGALAYALQALCGVNENDMMKNLLFSNFAPNCKIDIEKIYGTSFYPYEIKNTEGLTISERTINYLNSKIGVSKETLHKIIDILTTNMV